MIAETMQAAQTTQHAMGTVMAHRAFGAQSQDALAAVTAEIARLEGLLSRFLPGSDVSRLNESAGMQGETISRETCQVLAKAVEISRACRGCFDVTIEPLVGLWSTARDARSQPNDASIRQALALVNYRDLVLDPWVGTSRLRYIGQAVDLGGIGKGYAGDRIVEIYRSFGVSSAYSNLGGNVVTLGARPDGSPWSVGIQHPRQEGRCIGAVAVIDRSVVTSGDYQRYYTDDHGIRHHHILDPRTGYPAEAGLISVSIVAGRSLAADALSTALFVAGREQGLNFLKNFPDTEAVLVDEDLRVFITAGLKDCFQAESGVEVAVLE